MGGDVQENAMKVMGISVTCVIMKGNADLKTKVLSVN